MKIKHNEHSEPGLQTIILQSAGQVLFFILEGVENLGQFLIIRINPIGQEEHQGCKEGRMAGNYKNLPPEKLEAIINAAFEVFSKTDYKHASTDLIASKAGISKGLLFYYFKNKKQLYLFLIDYQIEQVKPYLVDPHFYEIRDFFELLEYSTEKKVKLMERNPYLLEFNVRAFYQEHPEVRENMNKQMQGQIGTMFSTYFKNVDVSKFRPEADPNEILHMLVWMTDGYMHQEMALGKKVDAEMLLYNFRKWSDLLKQVVYKEEYLNECH